MWSSKVIYDFDVLLPKRFFIFLILLIFSRSPPSFFYLDLSNVFCVFLCHFTQLKMNYCARKISGDASRWRGRELIICRRVHSVPFSFICAENYDKFKRNLVENTCSLCYTIPEFFPFYCGSFTGFYREMEEENRSGNEDWWQRVFNCTLE